MTDITELAQREQLKEKFEVWFEREYRHLESSKYTDAVPHIKYGFWMAYQAGGSELVEALEKAQQAINEMDDRIRKQNRHVCELFDDGKALRERIAELEDAEQKLCAANVTLDARAELAERQMAELESRTVKLPEAFKLAKSSSGLTYYYADEVNEALTAAGIKWEAE